MHNTHALDFLTISSSPPLRENAARRKRRTEEAIGEASTKDDGASESPADEEADEGEWVGPDSFDSIPAPPPPLEGE